MATIYHLSIDQGANFGLSLNYFPDGQGAAAQDWTGWTGAAQIRESAGAADILASFDVTLGSGGSVALALNKTVTGALPAGEARWDLELTRTSDGYRMRLLEGRVRVRPEVTV